MLRLKQTLSTQRNIRVQATERLPPATLNAIRIMEKR